MPSHSQAVAVVIVTWNSRDDIVSCLDAVTAEGPGEVVVVDNGSRDGTPELVRSRYPEVRCLELTTNTGFAAGCNRGIEATSAPFVLLLNADARVLEGYLDKLAAALEADPSAASAVGKLVYLSDGAQHIDSAGILLCRHALSPLDRGYGEVDRGQYDVAEEIFGPSGAAALYRRSALASLGAEPLDEAFFAYYEDVDLAWRLSRRGYRHLYVPAAVAHHARRGAAGKPTCISERAYVNRYVLWAKNESLGRFFSYAPVAIPWELARLWRRGWPRLAMWREAAGRVKGALRQRLGVGPGVASALAPRSAEGAASGAAPVASSAPPSAGGK